MIEAAPVFLDTEQELFRWTRNGGAGWDKDEGMRVGK